MKVQDYDPVVDQVTAVAEDASGNAQMLQVSASGALKVQTDSAALSGPVSVATTLQIQTAAESQVVFAATPRTYLLVQNNSDTDMWLGIGVVPTVGNGILLPAFGGGYVAEDAFVPSGSVNIVCSANGKAFYALQAQQGV